jgi:hypothetical protein
MQKNQAAARSGSGGYALLTVTVFALILLTAGVSYYSVATYETRGAIQRARMMQAFYLADGAVERARAKFLEDRVWRDGWTDVAEADGRYGLALADTVVDGERAMRITATGQVGTITRRIVLLGSAPPTALDLAILTGRNLRATGNLCLQGRAHANDDANFGAGDRRLRCGGTYTERFRLTPPALYTEPDSFPGATYYFLRGMRVGSNTYAKIYDADMNDITSVIGDSLGGIVSYAASSKTFTYTFANANISKYFADPDGKFARAPGDHAVVVNFGASPPNPPDVLSIVTFNGNAVVHATILNTRYVGAGSGDRLNSASWRGGSVTLRRVTFEPYYGIGIAAHNFVKSGSSNVLVGTAPAPSLVYATRNVSGLNASFTLRGGIFCLADWSSASNPTVIHDPGYVADLPDFLRDGSTEGVSGTLHVMAWREVGPE